MRGCGTDTVAADTVSKDGDFCPPLVGGQACCCSGEFKMTFYSDFTIQMILNKALPDRSYVMREAELLMEDYSLNRRESFHLYIVLFIPICPHCVA